MVRDRSHGGTETCLKERERHFCLGERKGAEGGKVRFKATKNNGKVRT